MNYIKLEIFDIVELRDGSLAVVLPESENPKERMLGLYSRNYAYCPKIASISNSLLENDSYAEDLTYNGSSDFDIMKVLKYSKVSENPRFPHETYMRMITDIVIRRGLCWDDFKDIKERLKPYGWTWVREECKEVTMADIEEKFGCKVKIIKEN